MASPNSTSLAQCRSDISRMVPTVRVLAPSKTHTAASGKPPP
jgi:hypothetical protein